MPYALKEWPRMRDAAQAAGFTAVTLRDPRVGEREWRDAVRAARVPAALHLHRLQAPAPAGSFGALNHFPIALVGSGDRLNPRPVLGVMPDAAFVSVLASRLRQLCAAPVR